MRALSRQRHRMHRKWFRSVSFVLWKTSICYRVQLIAFWRQHHICWRGSSSKWAQIAVLHKCACNRCERHLEDGIGWHSNTLSHGKGSRGVKHNVILHSYSHCHKHKKRPGSVSQLAENERRGIAVTHNQSHCVKSLLFMSMSIVNTLCEKQLVVPEGAWRSPPMLFIQGSKAEPFAFRTQSKFLLSIEQANFL